MGPCIHISTVLRPAGPGHGKPGPAARLMRREGPRRAAGQAIQLLHPPCSFLTLYPLPNRPCTQRRSCRIPNNVLASAFLRLVSAWLMNGQYCTAFKGFGTWMCPIVAPSFGQLCGRVDSAAEGVSSHLAVSVVQNFRQVVAHAAHCRKDKNRHKPTFSDAKTDIPKHALPDREGPPELNPPSAFRRWSPK